METYAERLQREELETYAEKLHNEEKEKMTNYDTDEMRRLQPDPKLIMKKEENSPKT